MSIAAALAPYRVTRVSLPRARSNGLWREIIRKSGPDYSDRAIAFWGMPSKPFD